MITKRILSVSTRRLRIAELSEKYPQSAMTTLNGYMDEAWLEESYYCLKKGKELGMEKVISQEDILRKGKIVCS